MVSKYSAVAAMMVAALICMVRHRPGRSRRTISASDLSIGARLGRRECRNPDQRALELTDVAFNAAGNQFENLIGNIQPLGLRLLRRMAMRVSSSGGWMSVISPH